MGQPQRAELISALVYLVVDSQHYCRTAQVILFMFARVARFVTYPMYINTACRVTCVLVC